MKKYSGWIMVTVLLALTSGTVYGRDVYREDIPDETFGQFLFGTFDQDKNGVLSDTECAAVTEIIVDDYGVIKSIEGFCTVILSPHDSQGMPGKISCKHAGKCAASQHTSQINFLFLQGYSGRTIETYRSYAACTASIAFAIPMPSTVAT